MRDGCLIWPYWITDGTNPPYPTKRTAEYAECALRTFFTQVTQRNYNFYFPLRTLRADL